jgi:hypothetical protein
VYGSKPRPLFSAGKWSHRNFGIADPRFQIGAKLKSPKLLELRALIGGSPKKQLSHLVQPLIQFLTCACVCIYIYIMLLYLYMSVCMCVSIGEFIHVSRSQTYCGHDPSSLYPGKRVPLGHQRLRMARNDLTRTPTWLCSLG